MNDIGKHSARPDKAINPPPPLMWRLGFLLRALKQPDSRLRQGLGMLAICVLILAVYRPMLPGSFLMDDHRLVAEDNPLVNGEFTIWNIWFQTDFILSNICFWAQWVLWGNHPGGYHAVNMGLHTVSAILLWRILRRLKIPGAWVAGLLYAVHPVAVTSVARIAELKNTLSLPFFLLSFLAFLHSDESGALADSAPSASRPFGAPSRRVWTGISLAAFVLALLAKTSTVMLPVVLLLYVVWRRGTVTRTDRVRLLPFFIVALFFGAMSTGFQKYQALGGVPLPPQSFGERLVIAGKIVWFYLGKVLVPLNLNAFYPVWKVNAASLGAYVPSVLVVAALALFWRFRRQWGRHWFFGLGCFVATLFPVLDFFDAQYLTWFQVSDHLQYLPMIAPLALAVALLAGGLGPKTFGWLALILVAGFAVLANERARVFSSEENLVRDCLAKNPAAWGAEEALGTILAKQNDLPGAVDHFETALKYRPGDTLLELNLGHALALEGQFAEAEPYFRAALKSRPIDPEIHRQYASALERQGRGPEAIKQWQMALGLKPDFQTRMRYAAFLFKAGNAQPAETQLRLVLLEKHDVPEALNNLAWLLATSGDEGLRNGAEAVRCGEKACTLTHYQEPGMVGTLAAAYAEAGRYPEAVKTCELTIQLADAAGNTGFSAVNRQLLTLYQAGKPYHVGPAGNVNSN